MMPMAHHYAPGDIVGSRTVLEGPTSREVGQSPKRRGAHYLTKCSCGTETWVPSHTLAAGQANHCRLCAIARRRVRA